MPRLNSGVLISATFLALVVCPGYARADCGLPAGVKGEIVYNDDYATLQFCDGTAWIGMGGAAGGGPVDGDKGDISVSGAGNSWVIDAGAVTSSQIADNAVVTARLSDGAVTTSKLAASAVTYARIQDVSASSRLLGRSSTGAGPIEEIIVGSGLTLLGGTLSASATGGVTSVTCGNGMTGGTITSTGTCALDLATAASFRSNMANKPLEPNGLWAAAGIIGLTDAATIALDLGTGLNFGVTLAGNRTLGNPTNAKVGQTGVIRLAQDATGSRTLSYGTAYKWAGGTAGVLSTGAGKVDYLFYMVYSSSEVLLNLVKDVR